jgi:CheY-like chemotaxis protein
MLALEVVEEAGFVTLEAGNADEAVALLESRLDISLLFTDVEMRGKHGRVEIGPRHARPLAADKNPRRIGEGAAAALRAAFEQLLCWKTLPDGCHGRRITFAGRLPVGG